MNPTIYFGLVTHHRTRFPGSAGPEGLVRRVARALEAKGVPTVVSVHAEDLHREDVVPLTQRAVRDSIDAELDLETSWRAYVDPTVNGLTLGFTMSLRRLYRRARLAPPWHRGPAATDPGAAMLRRLVNIELAHLNLLSEAAASNAAWALIVEDDAHLQDPDGFADALAHFVDESSSRDQPAYVNVSRSFEHASLGLSEHLTPVGDWSPGVQELASDRPLTNTVCAVLYRGAFLRTLMPALGAIPVSPVLPIDWKLNAALLDLYRRNVLGPGDCWFLDPAPIVQGSMHSSAG